jgi:hypothetical protein
MGIAHALVRAKPGDTVDLTLDTSAIPRLRPASPSTSFVVKPQDDTFVFDQKLVEEKAPRVHVVVVKPTIPTRLDPAP